MAESSLSPYFQRKVCLANDNTRLTANSEIMCYFPVDLPLSFSFSLCLRNVVDEGDRFLTKSTWCDCTAAIVCGGGWPGLPREIKSLIGAVVIRNGHRCVPGNTKAMWRLVLTTVSRNWRVVCLYCFLVRQYKNVKVGTVKVHMYVSNHNFTNLSIINKGRVWLINQFVLTCSLKHHYIYMLKLMTAGAKINIYLMQKKKKS